MGGGGLGSGVGGGGLGGEWGGGGCNNVLTRTFIWL